MPDYPPNCGERFAQYLTAEDGTRGITKPCGDAAILPEIFGPAWACQGSDYTVALHRSEQVATLILGAWNQVMEAENDAQTYPVTDDFLDAYTDWLSRHDETPILVTTEADILERWAIVQDGLCILDALDLAATAYGQDGVPTPHTPDPEPPPTPIASAGKGILFAALGVAVLGGAYILVRAK